MARQLLSIALTVDQHDDGDFYWMLLESFDNSMEFESLMESASGFETYIEALDAGYLMLKRLSDDLAIGPQDEFDDPGDPANSVNRP
ncbi:hypothetical protein LJR084_005631 [Variovorax sp. LjRoot84]